MVPRCFLSVYFVYICVQRLMYEAKYGASEILIRFDLGVVMQYPQLFA